MTMETLWMEQERPLCKQVNRDRCEFCLIIGTWRNKCAITWVSLRTSLTRPLAFIKHRAQLTFKEIRLFPANLKDFIYPGGALPGKGSSICVHGNLCGGLQKDGTLSDYKLAATRVVTPWWPCVVTIREIHSTQSHKRGLRVSFSSVTQSCPTLCNPMDCSTLGIINSWSLLKLMSIKSVIPSNHLILCHPLLLPPSVFSSIRVFSNESVFHSRWPKYWSFSFNISPSNEHSALISFGID